MPKTDDLEQRIADYISDFARQNRAAQTLQKNLDATGVGFRPIVDHITFRTLDVEKRAEEFLTRGFKWDASLGHKGVIEYNDWWAKVYRRPGFPAIFIDQAYAGRRGETSIIPGWVKKFGDKTLHHVAISVDNIENSIAQMQQLGIAFSGEIVGARGSDLRQIFTKAEVKSGEAFSVLELAERHHGYAGFLPPQADGLMKSSVEKAYDQTQ